MKTYVMIIFLFNCRVPVTKMMNTSFLGELLTERIHSNLLDDLVKHVPFPDAFLPSPNKAPSSTDPDTSTVESHDDVDVNGSAGPDSSTGEVAIVAVAEEPSLEDFISPSSSSSSSSDTSPSSSSGDGGDVATTTTTQPPSVTVKNKKKSNNKAKVRRKTGHGQTKNNDHQGRKNISRTNNARRKSQLMGKRQRAKSWPHYGDEDEAKATAGTKFFRRKPPKATVVQRVSGVSPTAIVNITTDDAAPAALMPTSHPTTTTTSDPANDVDYEPPTILQA
jgi:hypothetical protein